MKHCLSFIGLLVIGSFLAFLYTCIEGVAGFAGRISPAFEPWVFWCLFAMVSGMILWLASIAFFRPKPLLVYANPTHEDMRAFRAALLRRLRKNRHLRDAEVVINDEHDLEAGLAVLREKANEEIRTTAKQVFIGSAISQNGRLDTLIVLFLITRMTWRVAKLYHQRPHYRELINLYANIAATSFLAGSLEEFGIEDFIGELMGPLVGGSAIGAVPGAQAISGIITASILTGSTNCLLALRCGIVAREYVALNLNTKGAMRRAATGEASRMFVSMSAETVTFVTKALVRGATGAVKTGSAKAVRGVKETATGTAGAVGGGARRMGKSVKDAASTSASMVGVSARKIGEGTKKAVRSVGHGVGKGTQAVRKAAERTAKNAISTGHRVATGSRRVVENGHRIGTETAKACSNAAKAGKKSASHMSRMLQRIKAWRKE